MMPKTVEWKTLEVKTMSGSYVDLSEYLNVSKDVAVEKLSLWNRIKKWWWYRQLKLNFKQPSATVEFSLHQRIAEVGDKIDFEIEGNIYKYVVSNIRTDENGLEWYDLEKHDIHPSV